MSDKYSFRDFRNCAQRATGVCECNIPPPKTAYELLMEKQRRYPDITVWFTDEICTRCKFPVYTDGKTKWCSPECKVPGTYSKLQEDYIR